MRACVYMCKCNAHAYIYIYTCIYIYMRSTTTTTSNFVRMHVFMYMFFQMCLCMCAHAYACAHCIPACMPMNGHPGAATVKTNICELPGLSTLELRLFGGMAASEPLLVGTLELQTWGLVLNSPYLQAPSLTAEARKLEHGRAPTLNQREKETSIYHPACMLQRSGLHCTAP